MGNFNKFKDLVNNVRPNPNISIKRFVKVKNVFGAIHNWPEASQTFGEKIKFLESPHRHDFHVYTKVSVAHHDRDIEFFILQNDIDEAIKALYPKKESAFGNEIVANIGRRSCEQIAEELYNKLIEKDSYKNRSFEISVLEDDVNGAILQFGE